MSTHTTDSLKARVTRLKNKYDAHFAGQPRHTRDPELLEVMMREIDEILVANRELSDGLSVETTRSLTEDRKLYENEIAAIRDVQSGAPGVLLAHEYQTWVWLTIGRYRRNFAGQSRSTRDMGLLTEMIEDLGKLDEKLGRLFERTEAEPIRNIRGDIQESLELYSKEKRAIIETRESGTLEGQASLWADIANSQFELYRVHFSGHPRISRDIRLLERIIAQVTDAGERMQSFKDSGFSNEHNERNIEIVHSRKTFYVGELTQIRESRETTTFDGLVTSLGEAANKVFDEYRSHFSGQDRRTRDVSLLNGYCEGLYHIARQMNELDNVREHDINQQNLATVLDHLRLYDREFQAIQEAQQGS